MEGSFDQNQDSSAETVAIQIPLQMMLDFNYSRGILYYDEEHLNKKKEVIKFGSHLSESHSSPCIWVEDFSGLRDDDQHDDL
jgi:hypothetical protein